MTLICKQCAFVQTSYILDKEKALEEVLTKFSQHLITHKEVQQQMLKDVARVTAVAATVIMISKYTTLLDLPPEQTLTNDRNAFILSKFGEIIDMLEDALGVEVYETKPASKSSEPASKEPANNPPVILPS